MEITLALTAYDSVGVRDDCLESIRAQSVAPVATLLILDAVDEGAARLQRKYGIAVIPNNGRKIYHARNTALQYCTTPLLAFTDTDCVLDRDWIKRIGHAAKQHPEAVAGTGPHPMIGKHNLASWLHHMWFVVETHKAGYCNGVIGGNAWFRADALREAGGWLDVELMAAEDVYISKKLIERGGKIWFDEGVIARHHYKADLPGFFRQASMMGRDIVAMMRHAEWCRDWLWRYTLAIPAVAAGMLCALAGAAFGIIGAKRVAALILAASYIYLWRLFGSPKTACSRCAARWVFIWPYAWGVIQGMRGYCARRRKCGGGTGLPRV
jgi:glycosyltransferase involved in cell wall biosynthesis